MSGTRKLAAILAADVVGYSSLMGEDEAGTARAVRDRRDAAAPIVRAVRRPAGQDDRRRRSPRIPLRGRRGRMRDPHSEADGRAQRGAA